MKASLNLDYTIIDYDDYKYIDNEKCYFCDYSEKKLFFSYLHDKKIQVRTCLLCNITVNFQSNNNEDCIVYKSSLSQLEIIKLTINGVINKNKILKPVKIDPKSSRTNLLPSNFIQYLDDEEYYINGEKKEFPKNKYKIFFYPSKKLCKYFNLNYIQFNIDDEIKINIDSHISINDNDIIKKYDKKINYIKQKIYNIVNEEKNITEIKNLLFLQVYQQHH